MLIAWQWRRFCDLLRCSKDSTACCEPKKDLLCNFSEYVTFSVFCICFANFYSGASVHVQKFQPPPLSKTAPHPVPWQKKFAFSHRHVNRWWFPCWIYAHQNIKADLVLSQPQHPVFPIKPCNSKAKDISSTEISISFSRSRVLLSCFWACRCRVKRSALTKVSCSILCIQSLSNSEASTLKFRSSTKWEKNADFGIQPKNEEVDAFEDVPFAQQNLVWIFSGNFSRWKAILSSSRSLGGSWRRAPVSQRPNKTGQWSLWNCQFCYVIKINHIPLYWWRCTICTGDPFFGEYCLGWIQYDKAAEFNHQTFYKPHLRCNFHQHPVLTLAFLFWR